MSLALHSYGTASYWSNANGSQRAVEDCSTSCKGQNRPRKMEGCLEGKADMARASPGHIRVNGYVCTDWMTGPHSPVWAGIPRSWSVPTLCCLGVKWGTPNLSFPLCLFSWPPQLPPSSVTAQRFDSCGCGFWA